MIDYIICLKNASARLAHFCFYYQEPHLVDSINSMVTVKN